MKQTGTAILACCIAIAGAAFAETISVGSNVFSFPAISAVKTIKVEKRHSFFSHSGLQPLSRSITFSWSLPAVTSKQTGVITMYTLLGRVVTRIPVNKSSGTATWQLSPSQSKSGVYIARIRIGKQTRNLRLMLWN
jgi:hypothetical protein